MATGGSETTGSRHIAFFLVLPIYVMVMLYYYYNMDWRDWRGGAMCRFPVSETMSDEIVNIKCSVCAEKDRTREADNYCVECKDYFCSSCIDVHSIIPALRRHKLLDRADFRSLGPDGSLPSVPTQRCTIHQTEVINMYCSDHDEVACALCIALTHRSCNSIHSVTDETDNLYQTIQLNDIKLKINNLKTSMNKIKKDKEASFEVLKKSIDRAIVSIKEFRRDIEVILNNLEQETLTEVKKEFERMEHSVKEVIQKIADAISSLDTLASNLKQSEGNKAQEFVIIKSCSKVIANAEDLKKLQQQPDTDVTVSFTPDSRISAFLNQLKDLRTTSDSTSSCKTISSKTTSFKMKQQREINVKITNDMSECFICDSCIACEDVLLLTDFNNSKLKRLDMTTDKISDYLHFTAGPICVCKVSTIEAAVTLMNKTVQFVSIGSRLIATRTFATNHHCFGIEYSDSRLYITNDKATLHIHNMKGEELKRITGTDKFQKSRHISISESGDQVFVADLDKGLVVLDKDGNHLSTLTGPLMSDCHGVCTDGRNVFVGQSRKNSIVQIGQPFQLQELTNITHPYSTYSIQFDHKRTRLIVTHEGSDHISFIDLE